MTLSEFIIKNARQPIELVRSNNQSACYVLAGSIYMLYEVRFPWKRRLSIGYAQISPLIVGCNCDHQLRDQAYPTTNEPYMTWLYKQAQRKAQKLIDNRTWNIELSPSYTSASFHAAVTCSAGKHRFLPMPDRAIHWSYFFPVGSAEYQEIVTRFKA